MLNKALIAAATISILSAGLIGSAEAPTASVTVRDHRAKVDVRDHRTKEQVRVHRTGRRNEVVTADGPKFACSLGEEKLRWGGYKSVEATNCQGVDYSYRAIKGKGIFEATINAYNGRMTVDFVNARTEPITLPGASPQAAATGRLPPPVFV